MTSLSKSRTDWRTPQTFYRVLSEAIGGFNVDAAADESNHKTPVWYGPGGAHENALEVDYWLSPAFVNPPYLAGSKRDAWLEKLIEQARLGCNIVAILPAATGARWWAKHIVPNCDILFLVGRLPFEHPERTAKSAPNHDSAVCIFGPGTTQRVSWIDWRNRIVEEAATNDDQHQQYR